MIKAIHLIIFSLPLLTATEFIVGEVTAIHDGNTLEVSTKEKDTYRITLMGIDCPELQQAYGKEARNFLSQSLLHQEVTVLIHGKDRNKNYVGVVLLTEGEDVRIALLEEGLAWTAEENPIPELELIRRDAARNRKGLWHQQSPLAPWTFRRQQSMLEAKSR